MLKKKIAMEQLNRADEASSSGDPLAMGAGEDLVAENGEKSEEKTERKPRKAKRKKTSVILKIARKKVKTKTVKPVAEPLIGASGEPVYEVEAIVDHKREKGKLLYRVKWKGYHSSQDSWLTAGDFSSKNLLSRYKKKIEKEEKETYAVEKIIDHRRLKGSTFYRVRWANYSPKDDTWETKESLNCKELLKEYHDDLNKSILEREEAKLLAKNESGEYEVEKIMDSKILKGKTKYLIRWKGWDSSDDTWEPEETLNCPELIRKFKKAKKPAPKSKKRKSSFDSDNSNDSDYNGGKKKKGQISGSLYEVEKVLDARINNSGKWEFFVMWKGYGPEDNNWEPESNLNCPQLIKEFLGKDKVPRSLLAKLEQAESAATSQPKPKRKPPSQRGMPPSVGGLRGRTKGALKVLI